MYNLYDRTQLDSIWRTRQWKEHCISNLTQGKAILRLRFITSDFATTKWRAKS